MTRWTLNVKKCLAVSLFAALGTFLFGYHAGIISGSALFIAEEFHLTLFAESMLVSLFLIGAIIGAFGGGGIADIVGRRKTLFMMAQIFLGSALYLAYAESSFAVYLGRFFAGIAVGISSAIVPLYIAEISPVDKRGAFVCIAQVMITSGVLVSFVVSWLLCGEANWRGMFLFAAIPAAILLMALPFLPDSVFAKRVERVSEKVPSAPLVIGSLLNVLQQITGINIVICFTPRIFQLAKVGAAHEAIWVTVWLGVVNVLATLVGLGIVDRVGRRPLILWGFGGMAIALSSLGTIFFLSEPAGLFAIGNLILFIASFAIGPGLATSLICSEIAPPAMRGKAMGLAMFSNWGSNLAITAAFLPLAQMFGVGMIFFVFGALSILSIGFVWKKVPETKGKTFEEIGRFWQK